MEKKSTAADSKVAFVTGGNRGIGLETARQLAREGVTVVIGSRDEARGREAAARLRDESAKGEAGGEADGESKVQSIRFDITRPDDYRAAYDFFDRNFGRLDILINNAGVSREAMGVNNASSVSPSDLRETFATNFFGTVELTQVLLPLLRRAPAARIVNLSSILGSLALQADPGSPVYGSKALAYNASKTALNAFTVHLAAELRETPIKVNSAHPGWVKTEMGGEGAPLEIPDGARTSVALALLAEDGPTGGYFHMGQALPW
jgi:NAD(P)-dependent dehydrogenase (short-subunit alcohol dehydrogenase family)